MQNKKLDFLEKCTSYKGLSKNISCSKIENECKKKTYYQYIQSLEKILIKDPSFLQSFKLDLKDHIVELHRFQKTKNKNIFLFLNGTPFSFIGFLPLIKELVMESNLDYTIYTYDIRGMGNSQIVKSLKLTPNMNEQESLKYLDNIFIRDMKQIVEFICEKEGVQKINLFGWSWGGMQACRFTQLYPELVERLILTATLYTKVGSFKGFSEKLQNFLQNKDNIETYKVPNEIIHFNLGRWFYEIEKINNNQNKIHESKSKNLAENILKNASLALYKNTIDILATINLQKEWKENKIKKYKKIPVLMLIPNQDATPAFMQIIKENMEEIGMKVIEYKRNGKHPFFITHPKITKNEIDNFIKIF